MLSDFLIKLSQWFDLLQQLQKGHHIIIGNANGSTGTEVIFHIMDSIYPFFFELPRLRSARYNTEKLLLQHRSLIQLYNNGVLTWGEH